jgi:ABC-type transporter Mla subunit MlaD
MIRIEHHHYYHHEREEATDRQFERILSEVRILLTLTLRKGNAMTQASDQVKDRMAKLETAVTAAIDALSTAQGQASDEAKTIADLSEKLQAALAAGVPDDSGDLAAIATELDKVTDRLNAAAAPAPAVVDAVAAAAPEAPAVVVADPAATPSTPVDPAATPAP